MITVFQFSCLLLLIFLTSALNLLISFRGTDQKSFSVAQRDALLLFRTLCKVCVSGIFVHSSPNFLFWTFWINLAICLQMAMKEGNDEVTTKNRILSLELLQVNLDMWYLFILWISAWNSIYSICVLWDLGYASCVCHILQGLWDLCPFLLQKDSYFIIII